MRAVLLFAVLAGLSSAAAAEGPGTRIRATPSGPQAPGFSQKEVKDVKRCAALRDAAAKDRCIKEARASGARK